VEHTGQTFMLLLGPPGTGMSIEDFEYKPQGHVAGALPSAGEAPPDP
jgi:hypothetical protein